VGTRLRAAPRPGGGQHTVSLIGPGPDFDSQYAMTTDLDEPLIIASVTADGTGQPCPLLIDGYARPVNVQLSPQHRNGCGRASRGGARPQPGSVRLGPDCLLSRMRANALLTLVLWAATGQQAAGPGCGWSSRR
jgi:hypothetical protein